MRNLFIYVVVASPFQAVKPNHDRNVAAAHQNKPVHVWTVGRERPTRMIDWNQKFLPSGSTFHYFNDAEDMDTSVRNISQELSKKGLLNGTYEAFRLLRPLSYKSDIWRAMILWKHGGLYMDHKMMLACPLSDWINIQKDDLVMPKDHWCQQCSPGGMQSISPGILYASKPGHPAFIAVLRHIVSNIEQRYYGFSPLAPTGPDAYALAIRQSSFHPKQNAQLLWEPPKVLTPEGLECDMLLVVPHDDSCVVRVSKCGLFHSSLCDGYTTNSSCRDPLVVACSDKRMHSTTHSSYRDDFANHRVYLDASNALSISWTVLMTVALVYHLPK